MRALVVANDPAVQSAMQTVLADFNDRETALDRESALELFEASLSANRLFDLVIVDITAATMQDSSIIYDIRQIEGKHQIPLQSKARLIILSASLGRQLLTDCMVKGCDEFIDKPIDPDQIREKLTRLNLTATPPHIEDSLLRRITGKELFDSVMKRIDRRELELPPAPKIAMRIRQLVDVNADIEEVVDLLRHDLSISTKLIRISNSVAYGGFEKNVSTHQAVRRLGIDRSVELVMSICCRGYFVTIHPAFKRLVEDLWWHSLACAHATAMATQHKQLSVDEDLFALGLLHDIGKLILLQAASNLQLPKKSGIDIEPEALQSIVSAYHGQVGIRILKKWGYSKAFTMLIQHHRVDVETKPPVAMQVLHEADLLATLAGFGDGEKDADDASDQLERWGYPLTRQEDLKAQILSQVEQLRYKFG